MSQPILIEDFEGDLSNWTVIEGQMEISDQQTLQGNGALWMHLPNVDWANHILEHNTFSENFGRYTYHFFTDGESSDADLYIMYIDDTHYYKISCKPAGTDNPELVLCKGTPNGEVVIDWLEPTFDQSRWFKLTLERWCDGHTHVYIDDEQLMSIDDFDHFGKGTIRLRGWAANTFIDEVYFEPHQPEIFVENMQICGGDSVWLGGAYRKTAGAFLDTISDENANCLEVREVTLVVTPMDTIVRSQDLCAGDSIMIGDEWLREAGRYLIETTEQGCPILVDLTLTLMEVTAQYDTISFCAPLGPTFYRRNSLTYVQNGFTVDSIEIATAGSHEAVAIDPLGCAFPLQIEAIDACANPIYIPNAFSPNGDQINDLFEIAPYEATDQIEMTFYDRWGGILHSAESPIWDGRVNGRRVGNGVYLYRIVHNGRAYAGTVAVVR